MRHGRGKGAVALVFAVVAGAALGSAPAAVAAPPSPSSTSAEESVAALPSVWPRPQSLRASGNGPVAVTDEVALIADTGADPYAVEALRALLRKAGARTVSASVADPDVLTILVGGQAADEALTALGATPRADLPPGGYRLAVGRVAGRDTVALAGAGADGLFHGVQTLRQLLGPEDEFAGAVVRDWPGTAVRGTTEGFYGTPWTGEQRLGQLDFMGRTKQNRYLYAPGDDLYRQARWREPYPAARRAEFRELAQRARRNHVTLAWAVAPGQAMCLSSDSDTRALTRKLDAMWALGFRAFQVQFQDVSYSEWHCGADQERYGSGPEAAAGAQARVANVMARHLAKRHSSAPALSLMPTEYFQDGTTAYREALADALDPEVEVAWTGVGVVPRTITGRQLAEAKAVFRHPLVTMDNYPVNDYAQGRIFLGPYTGREPAVAAQSAALLANAMAQPQASRIPLFTAADYAWNPRGYRPGASWRAAVTDLAAGDPRGEEALHALAGNDASSVLGAPESAYLRPLIEALWRARTATDGAVNRTANETAEDELRSAFTVMSGTPDRLAPALSALADEVAPWVRQLARYGQAGETAVGMLRAQRTGDTATAWQAYLTLARQRQALTGSRVTVGKGVLDPFLARAQQAFTQWAGLDRAPSAPDGRTVRFPRARSLAAVTVLSVPGTEGTLEARVPGEGWRALGALSGTGATQLPVRARVNAVRVSGAAPSGVRHLVPWFADSPSVEVELGRGQEPDAGVDAEIGGAAVRVPVRLTSSRPADVRGTKVTVKAPRGIQVRLPGRPLTLPRGVPVDTVAEVAVERGTPAGTYAVPLTVGDVTRTLTVRVFPRTAGPDLARGGTASSSGDETADFPASAANDGASGTRWSSPAEDDAWWQVRLARPARLGRVELHWQDAYAAGYRVQVSPDGHDWRTAALVPDGRGGHESVRTDERDVRFVRVQGDKRATPYGYSLWSVEAYAVAD
ncbi:beta-N-acetylglucosaminidase domain-containing protein [Streptomyces sp. ADMS]|uniref:beta-N-acetylglucosaminidase domain-containing protein n=1 Tax=Streptomyces sp. ADMS TaxID=3071415 RepID=UPI00296ED68E|nr:beta-N-acetylglucosaminidase domain-containing protein [Streptomyces sp. ADMS]MDW4905847.1 beta-N-acetylglucosaminidase domain-containing protein [Streptomyces sp. ADMS]